MLNELVLVLSQVDLTVGIAVLAGLVCAGSGVTAYRALVGPRNPVGERLRTDRGGAAGWQQNFWAYRVTEVRD
ncbi:MAG: hypothetical protein JXR83_00805 [Deltaproteobacteria bacterium]|nr:hypothetical protein [Deltaproteobacteria bacterium]